jgi:hypothetical protein
MTCNECFYFRGGDRTCRRFPPTGRPSCWPTMNESDWCGEYRAQAPVVVVSVAPATPLEPRKELTMQPLEEGVPPKTRFHKVNRKATLTEIQETPLFGGE